MGRSCYAGISVNFFIAAAILLLFGFSTQNNGGPHGPLQLALAVVMAGAGVVLRTSHSPEARLTGLGAAGVTTAVGAFLTMTGQGYVPGTIVAIIALVQLASVNVGRAPAPLPTGLPSQPGTGQPLGGLPPGSQPWPVSPAASYGQRPPQAPAAPYGQQPPYGAQPEQQPRHES